jgi:hypothetical protein
MLAKIGPVIRYELKQCGKEYAKPLVSSVAAVLPDLASCQFQTCTFTTTLSLLQAATHHFMI